MTTSVVQILAADPAIVVAAAPYAAAGPLIAGTSVTPNVIDTTANHSFTIVEFNRSFDIGARLRATAVGFSNIWMEGVVIAWDGQIVIIDTDLAQGTGTGTYSDWSITVAGQPGQQGVIGPVGPVGPSGGPAGPTGPQGAPGSVWRNGNGVPLNSLGANGDYYLDDVTGNVYLRNAGTYSIVANILGPVGLTGPTGSTGLTGPAGGIGPTGPAGTPANVWRDGTGAPADSLGANGDYYLDDASGNVYLKTSGTYAIVSNIKGAQGVAGPTGPQGIIPEPANDGNIYGRRVSSGVGSWALPPGGGDVQQTLTLTAGAGLTGGGDLSTNRTFDVGAGTGITVAADTVGLTVPVAVANGGTGAITAPAALTALGAAPVASPTFTGDPKAPTPATADNDTSVATTAFVKAQGYAPLASPVFTGDPQAPTPATADNDTSVATTSYVQNNLSNYTTTAILTAGFAPLLSPTFTGDPKAPTPALGDSDTSIATTAFVKNQNYLSAAATSTITVGYTFTPFNGGTISTGTFTPSAANGNYQYYTNNGAHTLAAPTVDCAMDIMVTNGATAGAITFTGFTVGANVGDALTVTSTQKFIVSIRRINAVATYTIKALQ